MQEMSLAMWVKADSLGGMELLDRDGEWEFYMDGGDLIFGIDGTTTTGSGIVAGATHLVCMTATDLGSSLRIRLYIDGTQVANSRKGGVQFPLTSSGILYAGRYYDGGWFMDGVIDDIQMYNVVLTAAQVTEMYNGGTGQTGANWVPTSITETADLVVRFQNASATSSTSDISTLGIAASSVLTHAGTAQVDGLIGVTSGSFGVSALAFPTGVRTETFFTAQLPHTYVPGTDIVFHIHWQAPVGSTGDALWGLEWKWVNVNADGTGNTTVDTTALTVTPGYHKAQTVATLDGTGKMISSILICRLFRDGTDAADTCGTSVFLSEADFHFQADTLGSRQEWVK